MIFRQGSPHGLTESVAVSKGTLTPAPPQVTGASWGLQGMTPKDTGTPYDSSDPLAALGLGKESSTWPLVLSPWDVLGSSGACVSQEGCQQLDRV